MKKILAILGTITIAGSGMVGLVGNAPASAKNEINYLQTSSNNLENIRNKRNNPRPLSSAFPTKHLGFLMNIYKPRDEKIIKELLTRNPNHPNEFDVPGTLVVSDKTDCSATISISPYTQRQNGSTIGFRYAGSFQITFCRQY